MLLQRFVDATTSTTRAVLYAPGRESAQRQRTGLADSLRSVGVAVTDEQAATWRALLTTVFEAARIEPLVVVIDEAPYLIDSDPAWPSILQSVWDTERHPAEPSGLVLVLNGSAISAMTSMIASSGALFERPTTTMRIDPFDLPTTHAFLGEPDPRRTLEAQAACGGYPLLLQRWDTTQDATGNLIRLGGEPFGPLAANASVLLIDLADIGGHRRVLGAVGRGATKLSDINNRAGQRAEHSLSVLEAASFVGRRTPIGEPARKNVHYELTDGYLRFWFQLIDRNMQFIESGQGEQVIRRASALWTTHIADTFEREARSHAIRLVASGALESMVIGEWWRDSGSQAQVDVVGVGPTDWRFAGEVKWRDRFDRSDLHRFEQNLAAAGYGPDDVMTASWSINGANDDVMLIRPDMRHFTVDDVVR